MNTFRSMVCVSLTLGMFCSVAVAADSGACAYSAASRASWVESLARQVAIAEERADLIGGRLLESHEPWRGRERKIAFDGILVQAEIHGVEIDGNVGGR